MPTGSDLLSGSSSPKASGSKIKTTNIQSSTSEVLPLPLASAPPPAPSIDKKGKGKELLAPIQDESEFLRRRLSGPSDQKSGLTRDPEEVSRIIYEVSKGSKYFENEKKKDLELTKKVDALLDSLNQMVQVRQGDLSMEEGFVDEMIKELEATRVLDEVIVVVDADAFFASCAEREDPSLTGTAFAVGGGVLTTASYEARKYGCRSAQAGFVALKLCPHLNFVKMDFKLYSKCSREIFAVLSRYGEMTAGSLDEAYCSLTDYCKREKVSPAEAANRMREEVKKETRLTVSAGVSSNTLLSKIGADFNKPDGQHVIPPTRIGAMEFMSNLPIRKVPGIGRVSERWLRGLGVNTVGDIFKKRGKLYLVRKEIGLNGLLRAYLGLGNTKITQPSRGDRKGIGQEETFSPTSDLKAIDERLQKISEDLAAAMAKNKYSGRTINLKFKYDTYETVTRSFTLSSSHYYSDSKTIYKEGKKLWEKEIAVRYKLFDENLKKGGGEKIKGCGGKREIVLRLIGFRMSNLRDDKKSKGMGLDSWKVKETKVERRKKSKSLTTGLEEEDFALVDSEEDNASSAAGDEEDEDSTSSEDEIEVDESVAAAGDGVAKRTCPICLREIVSSLLALNAHVVEHLDAQTGGGGSSSSGIKRKSISNSTASGEGGKKLKKVNSISGYFTKK